MTRPDPPFDAFASEYEQALAQGLSVSGEDSSHFAEGRIRWLQRCLETLPAKPATVMDYGCGTGGATPYLRNLPGVNSLIGIDISPASLLMAQTSHGADDTRFLHPKDYVPDATLDLVYANGVFHHIPVDERPTVVRWIWESLRPGGWFALWENNPWNPGTRYIMSRIPFDRDAILLSPPNAARLVRRAGFWRQRTDFLFIFPRALKWLRWIEPRVCKAPLGAQYQILCQKPTPTP